MFSLLSAEELMFLCVDVLCVINQFVSQLGSNINLTQVSYGNLTECSKTANGLFSKTREKSFHFHISWIFFYSGRRST